MTDKTDALLALERMDAVLDPEREILAVPYESATATGIRNDLALIRKALTAPAADAAGHGEAASVASVEWPARDEYLFTDAMDDAMAAFMAVKHGITRNAENSGEPADPEKVVRRSLIAAMVAYRESKIAARPLTPAIRGGK